MKKVLRIFITKTSIVLFIYFLIAWIEDWGISFLALFFVALVFTASGISSFMEGSKVEGYISAGLGVMLGVLSCLGLFL
ncbi:hypothetical protein [Halobacillus halophilus]|uniref:hypothetical protein n=1 Tax=Halobacillus halophilus TaxID=1570 RepID=UPI0011D1DF4A|nr:hypothetical protein [Halobacillus halophilus]